MTTFLVSLTKWLPSTDALRKRRNTNPLTSAGGGEEEDRGDLSVLKPISLALLLLLSESELPVAAAVTAVNEQLSAAVNSCVENHKDVLVRR